MFVNYAKTCHISGVVLIKTSFKGLVDPLASALIYCLTNNVNEALDPIDQSSQDAVKQFMLLAS